jgi:hypothetical protein
LLRHPADQPSIGVILCKSKNAVVAEYALRDTAKPIGISKCLATVKLLADLKGSLPTVSNRRRGTAGRG